MQIFCIGRFCSGLRSCQRGRGGLQPQPTGRCGAEGGIAGVNLPMLLRVLTYRDRDMQTLVKRAVAGACDGVLHVAGN